MAAMIVQAAERVLEQIDHLVRRTVDRLSDARGVMSDGDRWVAFEPRFHHAAFVSVAALGGVLVADVYLEASDVLAEPSQRIFDGGAYRCCQRLISLDVVIGVDLDLHVVPV